MRFHIRTIVDCGVVASIVRGLLVNLFPGFDSEVGWVLEIIVLAGWSARSGLMLLRCA